MGMKKIFVSSLIFIITFIFISCEDQFVLPTEEKGPNITLAEQKIVSSSEIFGLKLFKEINKSAREKNIFISPLSVSMALGMTLNGANGNMYDSMKDVLELNDLTQQEINESYKSLIGQLVNMDPKVTFNIANSIWYRNTMTFEQTFINTDKQYFNASISGLDFNDPVAVDIINGWVNQNTKSNINNIIDSIPSDAVMYLINAIYFTGNWKYQFDKSLTKDDYFFTTRSNSVPCKMIEQANYFSYLANKQFQAVELPYGDSLFSMIIFLPNEGRDINDIINQFNENNWNEWLSNFNIQLGKVWLPKFELNYDLNLDDVLKTMGMGIAFSSNADFTKMYAPGGLFISEAKHKTYIKVDEEGTEASAVASVEISYGSAVFIMKINKPFIYVIRERKTNTILFIGKMVNPVL